MTDLTKPVTRKTRSAVQGRDLVVTLYPTSMVIRQAGRREAGYVIDYEAVYQTAVKMAVRDSGGLVPEPRKTRKRGASS